MFKSLRQGSKSIVLTFMFGLISLSFVFAFGSGADGCRSVDPSQRTATYAVLMNGKDRITLGDYSEKRKDIMLRSRGKRLGENQLNTAVINSLINDYIFINYAKSINLTVSDKERDSYIENVEYFQTDGKFDFNKYKGIIQNYYNTTLIQHERNMKKALLVDKVQKLLTSTITASEKEIWDIFSKYNKSATISYIKISPTVVVAPEELTKFLAEKDAEIKKYYDDHKDSYTHGLQAKASHILIKVSKDGKNDAEAKKKIEDIKKELDGGADFATLAKKYSEGPSKSKGGDLGYFGKGRMVKEFDAKVFSMKVGEISSPVKTSFGYHLIKLVDLKKAGVDSYDSVKLQIAEKLLKKSKEKEAVTTLEKDLKVKYGEVKNLEELKAMYPNTEIKESKIFSYTTYISGIGSSEELKNDTFKTAKDNMLPKVYKVGNSFVVAKVKEIELPSKDEFNKQKEQLKNALIQQEKNLFLQSWITEQRNKMKIEVDPTYITKEEKK